ncbi:ExeA family protein [Jannaschia sp. LMIT008]|uniref:ExeA family protein n=1 Tax=Jannaschia maritima TaxID=3032585 RepID=UPI002811CDFE|nr:AAA family ATPase [Jannaschia sp. LMIT008]
MARTSDIYCDHFGLSERPFSLVPDPTFLFWGRSHRRAFTVLEYGLMTRAPITLLTGEVGAGKTTLLQHLLTRIEDDVTVGLVSNAQGDQGELLRWVLHAFEQPAPPERTYVDLFAQFQDFLLDEYAAGRRVILIFDEAQHLGRSALEELRMYTNINSVKDEILQLILVGQPELRDVVARPDLTQFAQRVAVGFHLPALSAEDVADYIAHRMAVAGGADDTFETGATLLIHDRTGGVPRLVNQLCDFALLYAFTDGSDRVTEGIVRQVLDDDVFFGGRAKRDPLRLIDPVVPEGAPKGAAPEGAHGGAVPEGMHGKVVTETGKGARDA